MAAPPRQGLEIIALTAPAYLWLTATVFLPLMAMVYFSFLTTVPVGGRTASFTLAQAQEILLATHVGDEVLHHVHGYPLRAVVPSRRGWHWVKWLTEIEVVTISG